MGEQHLYSNRELSWIGFNERILSEAHASCNPIMERTKFLGITATNLDEFFMVRVSRLQHKIRKYPKKKDRSGITFTKLYRILNKKLDKFIKKQYDVLKNDIIPGLQKEKIEFLKWDELTGTQILFLENYFEHNIFPVLTPLAIDSGRPFPFLPNRSLNIAVELEDFKKKIVFGLVQIPTTLSRYVEVPVENNKNIKYFILMEEIIKNQISNLFQLHKVKGASCFRITRNFDCDIDEDTKNLILELKRTVKKRKKGMVIKLEISRDENYNNKKIKTFLMKSLKTKLDKIYEFNSMIDLSMWTKFASENWPENLSFPYEKPVNPPLDFNGSTKDMFKIIRAKDCLIMHPYESFDAVINFLNQAAEDPHVLAIKQTLYRVSNNSPVIGALIRAAELGKQVTVFVELKVRFSEEKNILWAQKLERAGCHVIYGVPGLKAHCKVIMIVRKEAKITRRYLHLGTGNYNEYTSRLYTDMGLFTCKTNMGIDASCLFNSLTGYFQKPEYQKLVVSPVGSRDFFKKMINNEIENSKKNLPSRIIIKVNSLVDKKIIKLLYKASQEGVKISLIVRSACCLIPGVKNMSENIKIRSIVGRFLEHSRMFYFKNGGVPKLYIGSSDLVKRNLDKRVETIFPIEDEILKKRVLKILKLLLKDTVNAWTLDSKSVFNKIKNPNKEHINSQMEIYSIIRSLNNNKNSLNTA